jgi:hypothetical protein
MMKEQTIKALKQFLMLGSNWPRPMGLVPLLGGLVLIFVEVSELKSINAMTRVILGLSLIANGILWLCGFKWPWAK